MASFIREDKSSGFNEKISIGGETYNVCVAVKPERISWGEPARIAACRDSRACGVCPNREATYEKTLLIAGIDFIRSDTRYPKIVAAYCTCGWSF